MQWTEEAYKSGGHKSELMPLLERCTRELQAIEHYRTDIRYLRLWIKYADCLPDPADVFSYLRENNIGQGHALYYIAYATYLELRKNFGRADTMYQQGINRLAEPLDMLRSHYRKFEHRMAARIQRKNREESEEIPNNAGRATLGRISGRHRNVRAASGALGAGKGKPAAGGIANNRQGGGLAIFVDDEFSSEEIGHTSAGRDSTWDRLTNFEEARKENLQGATIWGGQRLKQKAVHAPPTAAALEIPVDPEFEAIPANINTQIDPSLRQRLDRPGSCMLNIEESLTHDPLHLHKASEEPLSTHPALKRTPFETENNEPLIGKGLNSRESSAIDLADRTMTMSTQQAFAAINRMFKGSLPTDFGGASSSEPTITLSSKEAFEAVAKMLGGTKPSVNLCQPVSDSNVSEFLVRQDTGLNSSSQDFVSKCIREDTVYTKDAENLDIREDTLFVSRVAANGVDSPGVVTVEDDETILLQGDPRHLLPLEDEATERLHESTTQNIFNAHSGLTTELGRLNIENQENYPLETLSSRRLTAAPVHALQTLTIQQAQARGIDIDANEVIENEMVLQHKDSFEVFCDADQPMLGSPELGEGTNIVVDPFKPDFQMRMLATLDPPLLSSRWPRVDQMSEEEEEVACKLFKSLERPIVTEERIKLADAFYTVTKLIGRGSYASVFAGFSDRKSAIALKVEDTSCPGWEWYISMVLQGRLPPLQRTYFANPSSLILGSETSIMVTPLGVLGTLQDAINAYLSKGQQMDEALAVHFALELVKILKALQEAGIIHADIKPDNFLLMERDDGDIGLVTIDFGRSIDLELLPAGTCLCGDSDTDAFRCVEMREGSPWLFEADAYGVACAVHCLLYGTYMEVERLMEVATGRKSLRQKTQLRRYWNTSLWHDFFDTMLNKMDSKDPSHLGGLIRELGLYFDESPKAQKRREVELQKLTSHLKQSLH